MIAHTRNGEVLIGRDSELAAFGVITADLAAGRGRSVHIEGDAGIGKSALVDTVLARARELDIEVLRGECDELGRHLLPLSVMTTALAVDPRSPDPRRAQAAKAMAGPPAAGTAARQPVEGVDATAAAVEALSALVDRLCAVRPVILAVDDLHFADDASLVLWSRLSRAAGQLPLLLIGVQRPSPARAELEALREAIRQSRHGVLLPLERLTTEKASELARHVLGAKPGPRLALRVESAEGNPLYVREIVDAAVRSGLLSVADDVAELPAGAEDELRERSGAALHAMIADRLDFLSSPCRAMLQAAAVQGVEFTAPDVSELADIPSEQIPPLLAEAVRAGVAEPVAGRGLRFRHGLIRQALFDATPEPLRLAMYRDVAVRRIRSRAPIERTAEAVLRAGEIADGWQLDWLAANAEELAYRAPAVAADLLEHAAAKSDVGDPRIAAFEDLLLVAYTFLARHEEREQLARRILTETADSERIGQALQALVGALRQTGRFDEAAALAAEGISDQRLSPQWQTRLVETYAAALFQSGRGDEADTAARTALAQGGKYNDRHTQGSALNLMSLQASVAGRSAEALALLEQALDLCGDDDRLTNLRVVLLANKAAVSYDIDLVEQTEDALRTARLLAERTGSPRLAMLQMTSGVSAWDLGRWDDALTEFDELKDVKLYAEIDAVYHSFSALIAVHRDDDAAAGHHLHALEQVRPESIRAHNVVNMFAARASAAARAGQLREAVRILEPLVESDDTFRGSRFTWLPQLTRVAAMAGDSGMAARAAAAALEDAEQEPIPIKRAMHAWCHGLVTQDTTSIEKSITYFTERGMRFHAGSAWEDKAVVQATHGQVDLARVSLTEALSVFAELAAGWDTRRATARLRALGVRLGVRGPRQRPRTGWESLSETERLVAALVAEGMSNPDIAGRLILSRRTVQTHVSHILAKLGARSRREIGEYESAR